jgi:hypothetical protein
MKNGFDLGKYKQKLDDERAARLAKHGKLNTIGMKITRCLMYSVSGTMIWSVSTTFAFPEIVQLLLNAAILVATLYMIYRTLKAPTVVPKKD